MNYQDYTLGELLVHHLLLVRRHAMGILKALINSDDNEHICLECREKIEKCKCNNNP